ncbi:MAG: glycosyltransferase family 2 protein [Candidatus Bathyarchaeota archaeon]|nr:glycosyltransferase family 2 protein [Candidatus Bathyarchaeota archaeon]
MQTIEKQPLGFGLNQQVGHSSTQVIIAALNEEEGIGLTISELQKNLSFPQVLVVDGKSVDRTVEVSKDLGVDVLLQEGVGKGDAIAQALEHTGGDVEYVVLTDADHTYPAEYVPAMIEILERNPQVGMVCGNRFGGKIDENALHNKFYFGNKLLSVAHSLLNGVSMNDPLTGLRVIRADLLRGFAVKSKGFDIEVELNKLVERKGYRTIEVPITYRERLGEKKLKMRHGISILKRILMQTVS